MFAPGLEVDVVVDSGVEVEGGVDVRAALMASTT